MEEAQKFDFSKRLQELEHLLQNYKSTNEKLSEIDSKRIDDALNNLRAISNETKPEAVVPQFLNLLGTISHLFAE